MRDFLDDLERRLAVMAEEHPDLAVEPAPIPATRRRRGRRPAILGSLTALIAAAAAAFTMTGTSMAELPILSTDTQDASALKERAKAAAEAGVDFSKAHVFGTPGGPGYALVNEETQTLCLAVPDADTPGEYGVSCGTPLSKVEREGLGAEIVGDLGNDPKATALMVFVLPQDADDVRLASTPRGATFSVESGVAVIDTPSETRLTWTVDGRPQSKLIEGPFPAGGGVGISCPDGTAKSIPLPPKDASPAEVSQYLKAARRRVCK